MGREAKVIITSENKAQAGIKGAVRDLVGFDDAAKKVGDSIKNAFSILAVAAMTKKIAEFGMESVKAFGEVERKMTQLRVALGGNEESFTRMNAHIQALSRMSLASKGDIQSLVAQLAALGKSDADIERISAAAVNLSNVTGQGLNEAMKQVNATFSGSTEELGKLIPELRGLTKEQLASGGAVDLLNEKFSALSKEMGDGVSQRLKNLNDDFGDFKENIGESMLKAFNPMVTFINAVITGWNSAYDAQKRYKNALIDDPVLAGYLKKQADAQKELNAYLDRVNTTDASGIMGMVADPDFERRLRAKLAAAQRIVQEYELKQSGKTGFETDPIATLALPSVGGGGSRAGAAASSAGAEASLAAEATDRWAIALRRAENAMAGLGQESSDTRTGFQKWMNLPEEFSLSWNDALDGVASKFKDWGDLVGDMVSIIADGLASALEGIGAALFNQTFAWENLGAAALDVLAQILRGIGAQLIGLAAVHLLSLDFVGAAVAGAAAAAAYITAGAVSDWASSLSPTGTPSPTGTGSGGGLPGASYTGSQSITFNFYNQGNVVGSGGLEELAALINSIIQRDARYA